MAGSDSSGPPPPLGPGPSTVLYPGQSAPLATLTPTDQGGAVAIGAALALVFALISMLIRLYVRLQFQRDVGSRDDVASAAATVFFIIQSGLVFGQVHQGLGRTIGDVSVGGLVALQKSEYASDIFYLLSIWLTKCSIVFFFIRLSPDRSHARVAWICLAMVTLFTVASILATCLRCNLLEPWIFINAHCPGLFARWQTAAAFDIITEAALFGVAAYLTQGLKTTVSKKAVVLLAFSLRLLVIIPILLRLFYLSNEISSPDPTLDGVMTTICTQIHIAYAIIATTVPCLRPFMTALSTHYGGPKEPKTPNSTNRLSKVTGGSNSNNSKSQQRRKSHTEETLGYALEEITVVDVDEGIKKPKPTARHWDQERSAYRSAVVVSTGGEDAGSTQSRESQRMIISKNTEWQVEYQGGGTDLERSQYEGRM